MVGRDELLRIIRENGPVLPVKIAKAVETSILFASAMLSELVSAKLVKVSSVKIGGSPLYYLPEQKSMLQEFSKHLPQKEREAYEMLKNSKVLRESEQVPAIKVALRSIKDYSWPLKVTVKDQPEIFWKWYLISNEEAGVIIKQKLGVREEKPIKTETEQPKLILNQPAQPKPTPPKEQKIEQPKPETTQPAPKPLPHKIDESQQKLAEEGKNIKKETPNETEWGANTFDEQILAFFNQNTVKVLTKETIRKNEFDFIVELQSAVGNLKYYCKAKSKQRIGDGDLSSAYVQGELKKLPVLFLATGEPTKKAKEMLGKEFQNMVFKKIGGE